MVERAPIEPADIFAGAAMRSLRRRGGITQDALSKAIGVSFQQVQKYEKGLNRISLSRLVKIAQALGAPITAFFPALDEGARVAAGAAPIDELAASPGGQDLAEAFLSLPPHARPNLVRVAESMAEAFAEQPGRDYVSGGDQEHRRHVA